MKYTKNRSIQCKRIQKESREYRDFKLMAFKVVCKSVTAVLAAGIMPMVAHSAECVSGTVYSTPGAFTCDVPAGVTQVQAEVIGGSGGTLSPDAAGGHGGKVSATLSVSGGTTLNLIVGGMPTAASDGGASSGGAAGGAGLGQSEGVGASGGGASIVYFGDLPTAAGLAARTANQAVVAGGGGGGGGTGGGGGGGVGGGGGGGVGGIYSPCGDTGVYTAAGGQGGGYGNAGASGGKYGGLGGLGFGTGATPSYAADGGAACNDGGSASGSGGKGGGGSGNSGGGGGGGAGVAGQPGGEGGLAYAGGGGGGGGGGSYGPVGASFATMTGPLSDGSITLSFSLTPPANATAIPTLSDYALLTLGGSLAALAWVKRRGNSGRKA